MTGEMKEVSEFAQWIKEVYLKRYPSPSRGAPTASMNIDSAKNFKLQKETLFKEYIQMDRRQLLNYLTTQSNISSVVLAQQESLVEIEGWLEEELAVFYEKDHTQEILFGYRIWFCQWLQSDNSLY